MKFVLFFLFSISMLLISCNDEKGTNPDPKNSIVESVLIPAGNFQMGNQGNYKGDADEITIHNVIISKSFYIGKYEITQKQYETIVGTNPSLNKGDYFPVENVNWYEAINFCNKLSTKDGLTQCYSIDGTKISINWEANGWRLPTEAEWEYAAKAGAINDYFTGNLVNNDCLPLDDNLDKIGWYCGNAGGKSNLVGQKMPNPFGVYDMNGNVWEWCWDIFSSSYYTTEAKTDPKGAESGTNHSLRGGSWYNTSKFCRTSNRNDLNPEQKDSGIYGFRVVRKGN